MAASDAWTMSTARFRRLWEQSAASEYPIEFAYAAADDALGTAGSAQLTAPQRAAVDALTHPRVTIAVSGLDARRPFDDPHHHVRIVSATTDMRTVVVARQKLGASVGLGADVAVTQHTASSWTRDLVGLLPTSRRAGSLPTDTEVAFDPLPGVDAGSVLVVRTPEDRTAATVFAGHDVATCGTIRVQVGSIVDPRRPLMVELRYRDIVDDGRYLLIVDEPGAAMGVDDKWFAGMLNRVVNSVRSRHDDSA